MLKDIIIIIIIIIISPCKFCVEHLVNLALISKNTVEIVGIDVKNICCVGSMPHFLLKTFVFLLHVLLFAFILSVQTGVLYSLNLNI